MRYCIRYKKDKTAVETVKKLILKLEEHHFVLDEKVPEIVFSVGGDGTFLKAVTTILMNWLMKLFKIPCQSAL
jgi:NAD kinase